MALIPGSRLGPYEIVSAIGAGGMGEVYRARDSKLKREVAIKVLPQSLAGDPEALARFEREALAVAALSHPNILAIFDFGTHEGISYAVMELLEGETLRDKLDLGPISQKQAVDYAQQIVKGLSAAHERGVVHRDLKPENLFVSKDGHLKILDFGLAKRVVAVAPGEETSAPTVSGHTMPGTVMGTLGYMSPEQVKGLAVDHRSDIFSFGAVLYEMLSGQRAFTRPTASEAIAAILKEEPPDLSESGRSVSPALDHIVRHCLEKDRDNRFQTAKDIAFALSEVSASAVTSGAQLATRPTGSRKVLIAVALLLVIGFAGLSLLRRFPRGGREGTGVKRVAVLPFENLGAPEDDYFADGIADEIRGKLTSLPSVQVIARASSTPYKKTTKTPKQIAQELEVGYLLTATVRWEKSGGSSRVHVSPELIEVSGAGAPTSKWQQPFDAALTDVFQVQSDIASRVAQALGVALGTGDEKRLLERPTQNLAAYDAFLKGQEAWKGGEANDTPSVRKALGFYEQAVALDPGFAQAWTQVSVASTILHANSTPMPELAEGARQAAEKVVALAPDRHWGYMALGFYQYAILHDCNRALKSYARAQRVDPVAPVNPLKGVCEQDLGRWEAAMEDFRLAERLDPREVYTPLALGDALLRLRRYSEAREAFDRGLALVPAHFFAIQLKAMTFLGVGDLAGARAVLKAAPKEAEPTTFVAQMANSLGVWVLEEAQRELLLRLTPTAFDDNRATWALCLTEAYGLKGDGANIHTYAEEARKTLGEQLRAAPEDARLHVEIGIALAYLGRKTEAIRDGERGVALDPVAKDATNGPSLQRQLVRIYILVGEPEKALDHLEPLLKIPYYLSPGWLKIDPNFDPLRKNPRFEKLVASAK